MKVIDEGDSNTEVTHSVYSCAGSLLIIVLLITERLYVKQSFKIFLYILSAYF